MIDRILSDFARLACTPIRWILWIQNYIIPLWGFPQKFDAYLGNPGRLGVKRYFVRRQRLLEEVGLVSFFYLFGALTLFCPDKQIWAIGSVVLVAPLLVWVYAMKVLALRIHCGWFSLDSRNKTELCAR